MVCRGPDGVRSGLAHLKSANAWYGLNQREISSQLA